MTERDANNRKIAEWLEPMPSINHEDDRLWENIFALEGTGGHHYSYPAEVWELRLSGYTRGDKLEWAPRDFYTDESANAMLLDAMPCPHLWKNPGGTWNCDPDLNADSDAGGLDADRKTAIASAFIAWKEQP